MPRSSQLQAEISAMDRLKNAMDSISDNPKATRRVTMWFVDEYANATEGVPDATEPSAEMLRAVEDSPGRPAPRAGAK